MLGLSYGPGDFAAMALAAAATVVLARRWWNVTVVALVCATALSWSWSGALKDAGNVLYWGITAGLVVVYLPRVRYWPGLRRGVAFAALVTALLALTAAWSLSPGTTVREALVLGAIAFAAAVVAAELGREWRQGERLAGTLAWVGPAAIALSGALVLARHDEAAAQGGTVSGFLDGANTLGIVLALTVPFLLTRPGIVDRRAVAVALTLGVAWVITVSASRTGLLAFAAAVVVVWAGRRSWTTLGASLVAIGAGAVLAASWTPSLATVGAPLPTTTSTPQAHQLLPTDRPGTQSALSSLLGARDEAWRESVRIFGKRPVQGNGYATGGELFDHYGSEKHFTFFVGTLGSANVHDGYLQAFLELGVFGGLAFLAAALFLLARVATLAWRRWTSPAEAAFAAVAVAALFSAIFESILTGAGIMTMLGWISAAGIAATLPRLFPAPTPEPAVARAATLQERPVSTYPERL